MKLYEILKFVPEWEKPCWIHAIHKTLGTPETKIKKLAIKNGWDGESEGAKIYQVIGIVMDIIGKMPDLSLTRDTKNMTPKELSDSKIADNRTGLVFTGQHVMPMVHGKISNFNGHDEEKILAVSTWDKK